MGTINPKTGYVIERKHEIEGACLKGKVLVFPMSKGSTGGSYMLTGPGQPLGCFGITVTVPSVAFRRT